MKRIAIGTVAPVVSGGRYPAKAVVGEHLPVRATVWREGHDAVAATVVWRGPDNHRNRIARMAPDGVDTDAFVATVVPDTPGMWTYRVDAWGDPWTTWRRGVEAKVAAGQGTADLAVDLIVGADLLERAAQGLDGADRGALLDAASTLRNTSLPLVVRLAAVAGHAVRSVMYEHPVRDLVTRGETHRV